ncbi:MAG TPA: prolyl-tRNA synthetase associated domain-containing protein [Anaerolineaceae bacterium]|nr:prolyl-tRNA synthetase associated domain-containing protein [Anaerolineaceae bacterium]HPN50356.1 prolyl-tRNA synthetase associated domain-containing protein [Anaerolineaceae bacterium]
MYTEAELLAWLDQNHLTFERMEHPPVFTCEEAARHRPSRGAVSTKNLFLRDRKGVFYLLMTDCSKKMDLRALAARLNTTKLHLASPEAMLDCLGVTPGAVTVLALINDTQHQVQLWIDGDIWERERYLCHPLVNTSTLIIPINDLKRFFVLTGHGVHLIQV